MKKTLVPFLLFATLCAKAQLLVVLQTPPSGIREKAQLWNMLLTNTGNTPLTIQIDLLATDLASSAPVFSAATKSLTIAPGTTQLSNTVLQPVQYNPLRIGYRIDAAPNGLLPAGNFELCYSFLSLKAEVPVRTAEECTEIIVEPLAPPALVLPVDQATLAERTPLLTWLPPMPSNGFGDLRFDVALVAVLPSQSPADAIQQNPPYFQQSAVRGNQLLYPASAPPLQVDQQYAWRVTAKNGEVFVGQSETWAFTLKEFKPADSVQEGNVPFAELRRTDEASYAAFSNYLKISYWNESGDTTWHASLRDLTEPKSTAMKLPLEKYPLRPGRNLVAVPFEELTGIVPGHLYLLEIRNGRAEVWKLRFEFRRPITANQ